MPEINLMAEQAARKESLEIMKEEILKDPLFLFKMNAALNLPPDALIPLMETLSPRELGIVGCLAMITLCDIFQPIPSPKPDTSKPSAN